MNDRLPLEYQLANDIFNTTYLFEMKNVWSFQLYFFLCISTCMFSLFYYNYNVSAEPRFCNASPHEPWANNYSLFILGVSIGQLVAQTFRSILASNTATEENPSTHRHPPALKLMQLISIIQTISSFVNYSGLIKNACADFTGLKTSPFLWLDWVNTVPFMFFLSCSMDIRRQQMKVSDLWIQISGGSSILLLFLTNFNFSYITSLLMFILANILMVVALIWQQADAYEELAIAKEHYKNEFDQGDILVRKNLQDNITVTQCKMNCAAFMSFIFTIFPLIFYTRMLGYVDDEAFHITLSFMSAITKALFILAVVDCHVDMLDSSKFELIEQKKKSEEARLMFLRYVFHEVRVPLNSISLGIQLLHDCNYLREEERDTVSIIREATGFMAETLNDVLSLQKIEEGMLQLEMKPFHPFQLVKAVCSNFKNMYESKKIILRTEIKPNVPDTVIGDQFRLEHVLGNLLSNAIKFSDPDSMIQVIVTYGTKHPGYVTFTVKDEGPGMSSKEQKLLFQPFMQIRPGELQKGRGSGLGLSICKNIIGLHSGKIGCKSHKRSADGSKSSDGTEFFFSIKFEESTAPMETSRSMLFHPSKDVKLEGRGLDLTTGNSVSPYSSRLIRSSRSSTALSSETWLNQSTKPLIKNISIQQFENNEGYSNDDIHHNVAGEYSNVLDLTPSKKSEGNRFHSNMSDVTTTTIDEPLHIVGSYTSVHETIQIKSSAMQNNRLRQVNTIDNVQVNDSGSAYLPFEPITESGPEGVGSIGYLSMATLASHPSVAMSGMQVFEEQDPTPNTVLYPRFHHIEDQLSLLTPSSTTQEVEYDHHVNGQPFILKNKLRLSSEYINASRELEPPLMNNVAASDVSSSINTPRSSVEGEAVGVKMNHSLLPTALKSQKNSQSNLGKLLIVDDVLSNRKMLDMILRRKGFNCELCEDGDEALALVKQLGPDSFSIIFMDSLMPRMCGPEATRLLRNVGFSNLIIGVTGNAMDVDIAEYEEAGTDIVLTKPVRMDLLSKVLEYCLHYGVSSDRYGSEEKEVTLKSYLQD